LTKGGKNEWRRMQKKMVSRNNLVDKLEEGIQFMKVENEYIVRP
jgi:hypothetical protein